ncbi:MAG TPA: VCBS domain-containing protein, partial [Solimonas sp.]|nr:VCBS domain-containing protein [Solimonas sp.]
MAVDTGETGNMAPVIGAGSVSSGATTEDTSLSATGRLLFSDANAGDSHTASISSSRGATALGSFTLRPISGGTLDWTFTLNNAASQYLALGETAIAYYTVTIDDGHGGTASQEVAIT